MEHASHLVDVLNFDGDIIGQKKRSAINKLTDIYHAAYILVITPRGELVLSIIPPREDLPNLYARQFGATAATIRRHKETALEAMRRCVSRELFIDDADVQLLDDVPLDLPEGRRVFTSIYYLVGEAPAMYSVIDIDSLAVVNPNDLDKLIAHTPQEVAPTLQQIWKRYRNKLPI